MHRKAISKKAKLHTAMFIQILEELKMRVDDNESDKRFLEKQMDKVRTNNMNVKN